MLKCSFCEAEKSSNNSKVQHERFCAQNPNRAKPVCGMLGKKGGNQYTKNKDYKMSETTRAKVSEANRNRKVTLETRDKISRARKAYLDANPDKVPYLLNHKSKGPSYPELYWSEVLSERGVEVTPQFRVLRYHLDFAVQATKTAIEIDGEQHYLDPRIVAHDIKRTKNLQELGWSVVRIRWAEYCSLNPVEKQDFIDNIVRVTSPPA
jgi:very-short-patch-repair endonuclease